MRDLDMIYAAGYQGLSSSWGLKSLRPRIVQQVALLVCEEPERHSDEVLDWAMDALDKPSLEDKLDAATLGGPGEVT